jgi:hypothetical protein
MIGWIIVGTGAAATLWSIGAAIYWLIWPGETDPGHPKRIVLRSDR